jgi:hypothetical protein
VGEANTAAEPGETPDWLAAMAPADETAPTPTEDTGLEWMAEAEPEAEAAESPDWLAASAPVESPASEPEPMASTDSGLEWMSEAETPAEPGETPDWLAAMAPAEEAVPATEDANLEWMAEAEPEAEPAETPDWLAASAPVEQPASESEPAAESSYDWMSEAEPANAVSSADDSPSWLSELGPSTEEPSLEPEAEAVTSDSPSWLSELAPSDSEDESAPEEELEATAGETPDWLAAMAPAQETSVSPADFGWGAQQAAADNQPVTPEYSWLNEMNASEESELADAEFVDSEEMAAAPVPAENAPDWLNAMVPGLDVDYEAPEDEPVESEYIQGAARREDVPVASTSPTREFEWLNQIVAEEALEPVQQSSRRRFVFSRQPVWLRRPVEQQDITPAATKPDEDGDLLGWLKDDDADDKDFDLPPWLQ